ncbi:phthalate transporter [Brevundimonas aurifodinae]|uniref:Phthalate transporter n=2 Tax=Brevundimonas TaxID=41275 RepID=A0ABV1NMV6_9CAUL|nr:MAG: phthalate transporter [Brevundimonas sp. 12-68-7]OYX35413.1 MAG: phthalate transporter [Brevundimonas subvibrioides]
MARPAIRFDRIEDLPGQTRVTWRRTRLAIPLAAVAGIAWPPLILTLLIWPPQNWVPGADIDWRLVLLALGAVAVPAGLMIIRRERDRRGRPGTRLGIVWRFMLYGGLLAAGLQILVALGMVVIGLVASSDVVQGMGATETTLLIYGVAGLPVAILVGVSYALWVGLCAAFIAFVPAPDKVRDRLGLMTDQG